MEARRFCETFYNNPKQNMLRNNFKVSLICRVGARLCLNIDTQKTVSLLPDKKPSPFIVYTCTPSIIRKQHKHKSSRKSTRCETIGFGTLRLEIARTEYCTVPSPKNGNRHDTVRKLFKRYQMYGISSYAT